MTVAFKYFDDSNKALEYVDMMRADNGSELEVIAAECVTCKKDFADRARMRPDLSPNVMVFTVIFSEEDESEVYGVRHYLLTNWMEHLAESGLLVKMGGEIFVKADIYLPLQHLLLI